MQNTSATKRLTIQTQTVLDFSVENWIRALCSLSKAFTAWKEKGQNCSPLMTRLGFP